MTYFYYINFFQAGILRDENRLGKGHIWRVTHPWNRG